MREKLKLYLTAVLVMVTVMASVNVQASGVKTQCTIYDGSNVEAQDYWRYADTVKSYLVLCENNQYMRVQAGAVEGKLLVEYYDADFNIQSTKLVDEELSIFGAFYNTDDSYYVLSGQKNADESDSCEVFRITKYDKDWNRISSDGLYGANTYIPFDAGSARITHSGSYLLIRTCHEMYESKDGYHHQANVTIQYDVTTGKITDSFTDVGSYEIGYSSHSFNQFIKADGSNIVAVDHGDAYPRSVALFKYKTDFSSGSFKPGSGECSMVNMLNISGETGDNTTGVTVGGFEMSSTDYIVAGTTIDQSRFGSASTQNVFISTVPRDLSEEPVVTMITDYEDGSMSASTPVLVKVSDTSFVLMWARMNSVYYTELDASGKQVGEIYSFEGDLSDCPPLVANGKIIWYGWDYDVNTFYTIDTSDISRHEAVVIDNGHVYDDEHTTIADDGTVTRTCTVCGEDDEFTTPVAYEIWWKTSDNTSDSYYLNCREEFKINEYVDVWIAPEGSPQNTNFVWELSDDSVAQLSGNAAATSRRLTFLKHGTVTLTVYPFYNKALAKTYTFRCVTDAHKYNSDTTTMVDGTVTEICDICGYKHIFTTITSYEVRWRTDMNSQKYYSSCKSDFDVGESVGIMVSVAGSPENRELVWELSNDKVAKLGAAGSSNVKTLNFIGEGTVELKIYPKYNPELVKTKTFICKKTAADDTGNITQANAPAINVSYRTHIQTYGWEAAENNIDRWLKNGAMSGTSGQAKRLEGINIVVNSAESGKKVDLGIQYTTHCQSYGWLPWSADGDMSGTEGEAKRLEAIKIQLTGAHRDYYDVYYRVHAQSYGWLSWAKNGEPAGTAGYGKRLEGIQIVVVKKNKGFDGSKYDNASMGISSVRSEAYIATPGQSPVVNHGPTDNENPVVPGADTPNVMYRTHVQSYGWQAWKYNGGMSGTSGEAKRLEGIEINVTNTPYAGDIVYTTHVQTYGWQCDVNNSSTWTRNGSMAGTSGEAKRLEAICIGLTGEMAEKYDIYYRVHAQSYGWLGWAKNGEPAGTAGYGKRLEGIQIILVPKKGAAPADSYLGIASNDGRAYIKK